jgi:hypothetical protein
MSIDSFPRGDDLYHPNWKNFDTIWPCGIKNFSPKSYYTVTRWSYYWIIIRASVNQDNLKPFQTLNSYFRREDNMKVPIKILHIHADYQVNYMILFNGVRIKSPLSLEIALTMLENEKFDLIFFEPQNMAVFTPLTADVSLESIIDSFHKGSNGFLPSNQFTPDYIESGGNDEGCQSEGKTIQLGI